MFEAFRRLFAEHGLPSAIRSDNGLPFASPNGLYNLSKLSVWWLRLGIALERIMSTWSRKPCNPSTTRSARGCHPCLRNDPLPMSPGWTGIEW